MTEISSVEAVREKLRVFDQQMSDAISAAKALATIRADADKWVGKMREREAQGEAQIKRMNGINSALKDSRQEWSALNQELHLALTESKEDRRKLADASASGIRSIDTKVTRAEERLLSACEVRFADQKKLLERLDTITSTNAQLAAKSSATASEHARQLQQLLLVLRTDLQNESGRDVLRIEQLLDSKFKALQGDIDQRVRSSLLMLEEGATSNEQFIRSEASSRRAEQEQFQATIDKHLNSALDSMQQHSTSNANAVETKLAAFKSEVAKSLHEQQEAMSRQITDFLNKQNALVQNLTQQIDSFQRAATVQSTVLGGMQSKVMELATALHRCQETAANQFEISRSDLAAMRSLASEIMNGLRMESHARQCQEQAVQALGKVLDETLNKLKKLPIVGKSF